MGLSKKATNNNIIKAVTAALIVSTILGTTSYAEIEQSFYTPEKRIVFQDFGHHTNGGSVAVDGRNEYDIVREFALEVKNKVRELSNNSILVVENPANLVGDAVNVDKRVDYAKSYQPDLVVSYHADSGGSNSSGTHAIIASNQAQHVRDLAGKIAEATASGGIPIVHDKIVERSERSNKWTGLAIMRDSLRHDIPTILSELGFISNATEYAKLCNPEIRDKVSTNFAKAIVDAFETGAFDNDQKIEKEQGQSSKEKKVESNINNSSQKPVEDKPAEKDDKKEKQAKKEEVKKEEQQENTPTEEKKQDKVEENTQAEKPAEAPVVQPNSSNDSQHEITKTSHETTSPEVQKQSTEEVKSEVEEAVKPFKEKVQAAKETEDLDEKLAMLKDAIQTFNNTKIFK